MPRRWTVDLFIAKSWLKITKLLHWSNKKIFILEDYALERVRGFTDEYSYILDEEE